MIDKIKNFYENLNFGQLNDIRVYGLIVFLVIVLLITWSGVKAIQSNYGLQKQISRLQQEVEVQKLENNNLGLNNNYYQTNQYLELEARQDFGLAAQGETEVLVPNSVALAHLSKSSISQPNLSVSVSSNLPRWQKNFEAWMDFFLNRVDPNN